MTSHIVRFFFIPLLLFVGAETRFSELVGQEMDSSSSVETDRTSWYITNQATLAVSDGELKGPLELDRHQKAEITRIVNKLTEEEVRALAESRTLRHGNSSPEQVLTQEDLLEELTLEREIKNRLGKEFLEDIEKVLLPSQWARLNQIAFRKQLMMAAKGNFIKMHLFVGQRLNLSPSEQESFNDSIEKADSQYHEELQQLQRKFVEDATKSLAPETKQKLKEIIGEFSSQEPRK